MRVYEVSCAGLVQFVEVDEGSSDAHVPDLDRRMLACRFDLGVRAIDRDGEANGIRDVGVFEILDGDDTAKLPGSRPGVACATSQREKASWTA